MRVWVDDERQIPEGFDVWVKTATGAKMLLDEGVVSFISLDHDLGDGNGSGYEIACHIESMVYHGKIDMPDWECHSQNLVGKENINAAMFSAQRIYEGRKH